jgi:hypothetical protein
MGRIPHDIRLSGSVLTHGVLVGNRIPDWLEEGPGIGLAGEPDQQAQGDERNGDQPADRSKRRRESTVTPVRRMY